ncbi:MAG: hypothetical protein H0V89_00095, partial [Deltaproteobacteria bacterium]|nr:hypothetical protein [Deltaproteobacteria bacterium]
WRRVLDVPTHGLARVPGRALWTAGTDDGIRFSVDGVTWLDPEDGTEAVQVADLAAGQDGVWAATSDGLWFAPDAQDWQRVGAAGPVQRVLPDPDWVRGAWVAAPDGVLRTDDGGKTLSPGLGAQITGVSSLLWLGTGHLLAASADGVWESLDGGVIWSSRSRGLSDPDTRALAQDGATLLLAAEQGIFRLVPGPPAEEAPPTRPVIPLAPLLAAATGRPELSQKTGNRWAATVLPRMTVNFDWVDASAVDWSLLTGTVAAGGTAWGVSVGLTWTPRAQTNLEDALLPIDAVWLANDGPMSQAFAASTTRDAVRYRVAVSQTVADLYFARADLESVATATASLDEAVDTVLRIAEIDARLDLMTDGALSRLRTDPTRENP